MSKPIANEKRISATEALSYAAGASEAFRLLVADAWEELWNDPKRADIKPGHAYDICVQFREQKEDEA